MSDLSEKIAKWLYMEIKDCCGEPLIQNWEDAAEFDKQLFCAKAGGLVSGLNLVQLDENQKLPEIKLRCSEPMRLAKVLFDVETLTQQDMWDEGFRRVK